MKNNIILYLVSLFLCLSANAQVKFIIYQDENQRLLGFAIEPSTKSKEKPGILILPAWRGIDEHSKNTATTLASLGYYAFIADIYGEGNYPKDNTEAAKIAGFYKTNINLYQKRIALALEQLIQAGANPDNIVAIGFCFGGTGVLEIARANLNVKGVVSFHGGLGKDATRSSSPIRAKVLACHGADDPFVSKEEISGFQQEMKDTKADWEMIYYANAVHSFTDPNAGNDNSKGAAYNEKAAKRSFEHMKLFLNEVLKK